MRPLNWNSTWSVTDDVTQVRILRNAYGLHRDNREEHIVNRVVFLSFFGFLLLLGNVWSLKCEQCTDVSEHFLSQYRCGPLLGSGGFGSVFSGQRLSDGLHVKKKYTPVFIHLKKCALSLHYYYYYYYYSSRSLFYYFIVLKYFTLFLTIQVAIKLQLTSGQHWWVILKINK